MGKAKHQISLDIIEVVQSNIEFIKGRYEPSNDIYKCLFGGFVVHPCTKLENIEINHAYKNNKVFIKSYKKFIKSHLYEIFKNEFISKKYKLGLLLSIVSVHLFNKVFRLIRMLQNKALIRWSFNVKQNSIREQ